MMGMAPDEHVDVERELSRVAEEMKAEAESDAIRAQIGDAADRVFTMYRSSRE